MVALMIVLALLGVLSWCGITGRGVTDSRDPRFGLSLARWHRTTTAEEQSVPFGA